MKHLDLIKSCNNLQDVAFVLGYKPSRLAYILYKMPNSTKYREFEIDKKLGGKRKIFAPCPELKTLQQRLSKLLQNCIAVINKEKGIQKSISHGFKRDCSIFTNAEQHRNKRFVLNIDLEDFFGTINFGRVRGFFIKNKNFEIDENAATVLAQIACFNNSLPQGSPSSPVITNLISHTMDIRLAALAKQLKCTYSRYADDITFSTNEKNFPIELAEPTNAEGTEWKVGKKLERKIQKLGFSVNHKKTRLQFSQSRQDVTGLVVNKKVNIKSEYHRSARAMAHSLFKTGKFHIKENKQDANGNIVETKREGKITELGGYLNFIDMADKYRKRHVDDYKERRILSSREEIYRDFLFFRYFYQPSRPIILCEGKTDYIYLKCAIKSQFSKYPNLCQKNKQDEKILKVDFFKYTEVKSRLFSLSGGASTLSTFIGNYTKFCETYSVEISKNPVIIVVDNDMGVNKVFSSAKTKKYGKSKGSNIDGSLPFYHLGENLYLTAIPKKLGKDTAIEDYFKPTVLSTKYNGKTFNYKNKTKNVNPKTEYSKAVFAEHVIEKNRDKIDFSDFTPILDNICAAINDYSKKK
ncbi:retron Ec67 family RNA-directed DNA polymerase/endonuclease [Saccharophagus degradans]|uniref:retron Ec67 family RNA-directed DNA polymerase/endonuclease n=1 Tax=Saccharophagus degradans TaxID=86304 RepID=UPI001C0843CC|nr:retron Ec67 family RNA-directed DNA polymerase/endonuclease [Saccharophagus degradans]MBU2985883.1 retron Ec67 family RNA-directed DNA polymerase/endonuclease [Saccharophagus degradans]